MKYIVSRPEVYKSILLVEAKNEKEAKEKALNGREEHEIKLVYDYTIDDLEQYSAREEEE